VLKGRSVKIDTFGVPATPDVVNELQTMKMGDTTVWSLLESAGVQMTENASCAACLGGPVDTFGRMNKPMNCISATNRNFPGRMGHKESKVFLASPMARPRTKLDRSGEADLVIRRLETEPPGARRERLLAVRLGLAGELGLAQIAQAVGALPCHHPDLV
jgi:hypothetical protein